MAGIYATEREMQAASCMVNEMLDEVRCLGAKITVKRNGNPIEIDESDKKDDDELLKEEDASEAAESAAGASDDSGPAPRASEPTDAGVDPLAGAGSEKKTESSPEKTDALVPDQPHDESEIYHAYLKEYGVGFQHVWISIAEAQKGHDTLEKDIDVIRDNFKQIHQHQSIVRLIEYLEKVCKHIHHISEKHDNSSTKLFSEEIFKTVASRGRHFIEKNDEACEKIEKVVKRYIGSKGIEFSGDGSRSIKEVEPENARSLKENGESGRKSQKTIDKRDKVVDHNHNQPERAHDERAAQSQTHKKGFSF